MGKKLCYLTSCHSTNDVAMEMIKCGEAFDGTLVVTDDQTEGRGQRGNTWDSQPGKNLTCSLILKPQHIRVSRQFMLNMIVSLGVQDYLKTLGEDFIIKWPNDIYYKESKLGGILIQNTLKGSNLDCSVIGIGLNVNQERFDHPKAISLKHILGDEMDLQDALENLMWCVESRYMRSKNIDFDTLKAEYLESLLGFGVTRTYFTDRAFEAKITDVTEAGKLELTTEFDKRYFDIKEVAFI